MTVDIPHRVVKMIDCHDLDRFLESQLGKPWSTLTSERDNELANGKWRTYEADAEDDHEYTQERLEAVREWLGRPSPDRGDVGEWGSELVTTEDLLCYLVSTGVIAADIYDVHLWW